MTNQDQADLDVMIAIARQVAARQIMPRFRNLAASEIEQKANAQDLVTIADRAAEADMTSAFRHIWPGVEIIGEEAAADDPGLLDRIAEADRCVIIDPVDGTSNFAAGLADFGVILALVRNGETRAGVLYDPVLDDWVAGCVGQGAWYQRAGSARRPLATRHGVPPEQAEGFVSMGFWTPQARAAEIARYAGLGYLRTMRCSCHEYRTLAFGRVDFIMSEGLNPWDHAAGVLIVQEAGGAVSVAGEPAYRPSLRAGRMGIAGDAKLLEHLPI